MKLLSEKTRNKLVYIKNHNPYLRLLWLHMLAKREKKEQKFSDEEVIRRMYYSRIQKYPNLTNPEGFSEKLQWLKLHYRNDLMPILADKYEVREYLEKHEYGYLLNELYSVYESVDSFDPSILPNQFVLKATHASGWNLIVKDKSKINWWIWKKHMNYWLKHNIAWMGKEWHYAEMKPRIVCEKYLEDESGGLIDYKIFCFNGEPKYLQLNVNRGKKNYVLNLYDLDWNLMPFSDRDIPQNPKYNVRVPEQFEEMVKLSKELSEPFPFVRLDFYEVNNRIYFGEFTFFPGSGNVDITPLSWDKKVGNWLILPSANN